MGPKLAVYLACELGWLLKCDKFGMVSLQDNQYSNTMPSLQTSGPILLLSQVIKAQPKEGCLIPTTSPSPTYLHNWSIAAYLKMKTRDLFIFQWVKKIVPGGQFYSGRI